MQILNDQTISHVRGEPIIHFTSKEIVISKKAAIDLQLQEGFLNLMLDMDRLYFFISDTPPGFKSKKRQSGRDSMHAHSVAALSELRRRYPNIKTHNTFKIRKSVTVVNGCTCYEILLHSKIKK